MGWLQGVDTTTHVLFFIIKCDIACFLCTMHVFDVLASSSSHSSLWDEDDARTLNIRHILFLLQPPLLSWPMEKCQVLNHSLSHPAYMMPCEPKLLLRNCTSYICRMLHYAVHPV